MVGNLTLEAGDRYFVSGEVRVRYTVEGKGIPVFLVHGFTEYIEKGWKETGVFDALVSAGYRVIAVDCRGHGKSGRPRGVRHYGMAMVEDLIGILDQLEIQRAHFVGYSMGSVIVNRLRDRHPQRLLTATLSGYGQPPLPDTFSDALVEQIRSNLERMALLEGNDPVALAYLSVQWRDWLVSDDSLVNNGVPSLAVIGEDDHFLNDTKALARRMSRIQLEIIPGDHGNARQKPEFVKTLLAFLAANSGEKAGTD